VTETGSKAGVEAKVHQSRALVQGHRLAQLVEWFWRGRAMRETIDQAPVEPLEVPELRRRARLCAEAARRMLEPPTEFEDGAAAALACELYRQSLYWVLRAQAASPAAPSDNASPRENLVALWERADSAVLERAAQGTAKLAELKEVLGRNFVDFAELAGERQTELAWRLRSFVEALLSDAGKTQVALERLAFQRLLRFAGLIVALLSLGVAYWFGASALEERRDLAKGKAWRASSLAYVTCESPEQDCLSAYFFHTKQEAEPWLEIDLGEKRTFSSVRVLNREDCCQERAVPLVIEVSDDGKEWLEVKKRTKEFVSWRTKFEPVNARLVRLRAPKKTSLHLRRVMVLP
jgi:hypothetical protein